ncbi:MAG: sugar phosphate isomerase/epimerase [Bryobacterales bacterium]|nr:sugar phosphate isomerase/epimerase [Bryobacterales bacterium]
MTRRTFIAATAAAGAAAQPSPPAVRSGMGFSPDCFVIARPSRDAIQYLEYAYSRGAGGVQAGLMNFEPEYLRTLRQRSEQLGMYLEISTMLPKPDDSSMFEKVVRAAKECGAYCLRSVCLSGRRYETFNTLEEWKTFVSTSHARLERAARILEKERFPLGLENHKDWTVEEMAPLMKKFSSEYLGTCIDWGNNVSLLDDPYELAEALGPFIVNAHIKDMALEEYEDGFLLAEVPLGEGYFDLKRIAATLQKHRPKVKFSLDMLTRNPLKIPCLTEKYWVTFTGRNGKYLARTLAAVRANKPRSPVPRPESMDQAARLQLEQENVRKSVLYARDELGLKV